MAFYHKVLLGVIITLLLAAQVSAATVTALTVVHRGGQSYITFTKNTGSNGSTTYGVRRSLSPINASTDGTLIATLDADSWHLLYDDASQATPHLSSGFIIPGSVFERQDTVVGTVTLASTQGLLVWTTATQGCYYYAVTNSNDTTTITSGVNSLASCISESHEDVSGWVLIDTPTAYNGLYTTYKFYRWRDYSTWKTRQWGYYGVRTNVQAAPNGRTAPYGIMVFLHGAQDSYQEPANGFGFATGGITIAPVSLGAVSSDPYALDNLSHGNAAWQGAQDTDTSEAVLWMEQHVVDAVKLVRNSPVFLADWEKIAIEGSSMGSQALKIAYHHPELFGAGAGSSPLINNVGPISVTGGTLPVRGVAGSPTLNQYSSPTYLTGNNYRLPFSVVAWTTDDSILDQSRTPGDVAAFETNKYAYVTVWGGHTIGNPTSNQNDHAAYGPSEQGDGGPFDYLNFSPYESYPAFSNASTSETMPQDADIPGSGAPGYCSGQTPTCSPPTLQVGQRNMRLFWKSSRYTITSALPLVDTSLKWRVSIKSQLANGTTDLTIRNAQNFHPAVGATVTWSNKDGIDCSGSTLESGTLTVPASGLVTVTSISIKTGGTCAQFTIPAPAGWNLINHGHFEPGSNGGASPQVDITGADTVIVGVAYNQAATAPTLTGNLGVTFTGLTAVTATGEATAKIRLFYAKNVAGAAGFIMTIAGTSTITGVTWQAWAGGDPTNPFVSENEYHSPDEIAGNSMSTGSVTPTGTNDLVVTLAMLGSDYGGDGPYQRADELSINSGFTITDRSLHRYTVSHTATMASKLQTGAINPTWSWNGSQCTSATVIATFKASAGGGTGGRPRLRRLP